MTGTAETFQIPPEIAEMYEAAFVPRLFGRWAELVVETAGLAPGQRVLDVACGTGVVARVAAERLGEQVSVVGLDLNEAMLAVARRLRPDLEWRQGDAAQLPFPDGAFDVVLCQSGLMFFPDPVAALREMARVVTPTGTVAVQVWDRLDAQPAYRPFTDVAARHAGPEAVDLLGTYFVHGDLDHLARLFAAAGLDVSEIRTETSVMRFSSIDEFVNVEVGSTPLVERLSDDVLGRILEESREVLASFGIEAGAVGIPITGHIVTARKR